jgi:predicted RNA-binding protein
MSTQKIYTQHEENKEWASSLAFYKDEVKIMETRLSEIVSKNTSKDILAQAEHFQNQLIIQKDQIDQINHIINLDNDIISKEINKNEVAVDRRSIEDHTILREQMKSFEHIFSVLKLDFNSFLSKWM